MRKAKHGEPMETDVHDLLRRTLDVNWPWASFQLKTQRIHGQAKTTLKWRNEPSHDEVEWVLSQGGLYRQGAVEALSFNIKGIEFLFMHDEHASAEVVAVEGMVL